MFSGKVPPLHKKIRQDNSCLIQGHLIPNSAILPSPLSKLILKKMGVLILRKRSSSCDSFHLFWQAAPGAPLALLGLPRALYPKGQPRASLRPLGTSSDHCKGP